MPLKYYPRAGEILVCDYPNDMRVPEMIKTRPVIVVSPRLRGRGNLIIVVPPSATKPATIMPYHFELTLPSPLPSPWGRTLAGLFVITLWLLASIELT